MTRPFAGAESELSDRAYQLIKTRGVKDKVDPELALSQSGPQLLVTYCNIGNIYIHYSAGILTIWTVVSGSQNILVYKEVAGVPIRKSTPFIDRIRTTLLELRKHMILDDLADV